MVVYVGNDKSGVFVEVFNIPNLDIVMRYLEGFYRYTKKEDVSLTKATITKDGFYLDFDYMSVEIGNRAKKSLSDRNRRSILTKLRINPIRLMTNSHFNYLQNNFSWDQTKNLFQICFNIFKQKLIQFSKLNKSQLRNYLIPQKLRVETIIKYFFKETKYGCYKDNVFHFTENDFGNFLRDYAKTEFKDYFKEIFIDNLEITDIFELSITADVSFDDVNQRISFLQRINEFSIPSMTKNEFTNESILFDPYDKKTSTSLLQKKPRIRAYLKLNNVNALFVRRLNKLTNDYKRINHEMFKKHHLVEFKEEVRQRYKLIKQSIVDDKNKAVEILQNVVRLEIDHRTNNSVRAKYKTANFYELGFDNRKEITDYFQTHLNAQISTISIQEAVDVLNEIKVRRKGSIARSTLLNLTGLPFSQIASILESQNVTEAISSDDKTAKIRNMFYRLKKVRNDSDSKKYYQIIKGEGQNISVQSPFKQALAYINSQINLPIGQLFASLKTAKYTFQNVTELDIYNNINIIINNNYNKLREDYNISNGCVSLLIDSVGNKKSTLDADGVVVLPTNKLLDAIRGGINTFTNLEKLGFTESQLLKLKSSGDIIEIKPNTYQVLE